MSAICGIASIHCGGRLALETQDDAGNGAGGGAGGATGSGPLWPINTCPSTCLRTPGVLHEFRSLEQVHEVLAGRWQICPGGGKPFGAPDDVVGIEYGSPDASGTGNIFLLVKGSNGPIRGSGAAYRQTYDNVNFFRDSFQITVHRDVSVAANFQYSPCPDMLMIDVSAMPAKMSRF